MDEADVRRLITQMLITAPQQPGDTKRSSFEVVDLLTITGDLAISTQALNRLKKRYTTGGTVNIIWPGGANLSNSTTVTHGFASAPSAVVGTMGVINNTGGGTLVNVCAVQVINIGAATFDIRCQYLPLTNVGATASNTVTWMAIF